MRRVRTQDQWDLFAPAAPQPKPSAGVKPPPYSAVEVERLHAGKSMVCLGARGRLGDGLPLVAVCYSCVQRIGAQALLAKIGAFKSWLWEPSVGTTPDRWECAECGRPFVAEATVDMQALAG